MADKQGPDPVVDVLKDILAVQLLLSGVPQRDTRSIVKCDMNRITAIAKALKGSKEKPA